MTNLISIFEDVVEHYADSVAVLFNDRVWTYRHLNQFANYIAGRLIQQGVKPNCVVAISGSKSFEMMASILAILKCGCCYMPIDSELPLERIHFMLNNAGANVLILCSWRGPQDQFFAPELTIMPVYEHEWDGCSYPNLNHSCSSEDPAYIVHTSGSTGVPKGVVVPHRGLIRLLMNTNYIDIHSSDTVLFHSNTSFDAGIFEVWAGLLHGAKTVITDCRLGDVFAIYKLCQQYQVSVLLLTTGLFHVFSRLDLQRIPQLRYLVVGGDVMHASAALKVLEDNPNITIINGYGPAENCVFTTCLVITDKNDISDPVSIGRPITGTQIYVLDEAYQIVADGDVGELFTSGAGVALGYINAPDLTQQKFLRLSAIAGDQVLYRTGDRVRQLASGDIEFVCRQDTEVKIRGYRVELSEVEQVISTLDFVEDVCVCLLQKQHAVLAAYVKINKALSADSSLYRGQIFDYLRQKLPNYCIPSYIEMSHSFPLTLTGKMDRRLIQQDLLKKYEVNHEYMH